MLSWFYDLPIAASVLLASLSFVAITLVAGLFVRPRLSGLMQDQPDRNTSVGYFLAFFNLMNGLLLSLLAVATYQNHANVERIVVRESASLAALYRDVSSLPQPARGELQDILLNHTRIVIEEDWPIQRRGHVPTHGTEIMDQLQTRMIAFKPENRVQEMVQAAAFRQFNDYIEWRRLRLHSVKSDMPSVLWYAVGIGLAMHLALFLFLELRTATFLVLGGVTSFFAGTVVCMILLLDHPFRGPFGASVGPFLLLHDVMHK